jgi:hypothetical protein
MPIVPDYGDLPNQDIPGSAPRLDQGFVHMAVGTMQDQEKQIKFQQGPQTDYEDRLFQIESGYIPGRPAEGQSALSQRTGSNRGLGQFGPKEEQRYGITNWLDPNQQRMAVRREAGEHRPILQQALGRDPTPGEMYVMHQQGIAGGPALLTNPDKPAWEVLRPYYSSDRMAKLAIHGNTFGLLRQMNVENITAKQFTNMWINKFEKPNVRDPQFDPDYITAQQSEEHGTSAGYRHQSGYEAVSKRKEPALPPIEGEEAPRFKPQPINVPKPHRLKRIE